MWHRFAILILLFTSLPVRADEVRSFTLFAAPEIVESGLLDYILPRFTLKTGRRVNIADTNEDARLAVGVGQQVMTRGDVSFGLELKTDNPAAQLFVDWLMSEIGHTALEAFVPVSGPGFEPFVLEDAQAEITFEGDAALGREVAEIHCARCHRVAPEGRGIGIGSTPSFAALKALPDWAERFSAFYALNPHPSFLRVTGISPDFAPAHPPPIVPVEITQDELEHLLAYTASLPAADLGADVVNR